MKILNLLCDAQDNELTPRAVKRLADNGHNVDVWQYGISDVDENEKYFHEIAQQISEFHLIIIRMHAGLTYFKKFERLRELIVKDNVPTLIESEMEEEMKDNRSLFAGSEEDYITLRSYIELGGDGNEYNLLAWLIRDCESVKINVEEPKRRPAQGIYIPGKGMSDELPKLDGSKPTVGLMISQVSVANNNVKHIDALIAELESHNVNVIPVFMVPNPGEIRGSIGITGCVRKYFMNNGKPIIDSAIVTMGFSMLCLSDPGDGSGSSVKNIFEELGVPVIQASTLLGPKKNWEDNPIGFGPFEISMNVFWPEYDGQTISFPFASTERSKEGRLEFQPIEDRVQALSKLAVNWAVLRRTPTKDRRIAILLHQNPPRNDMVGGAFGLDSTESTVDLLKKMATIGYTLDSIPENGQDLTKILLSGVSNDTDWLSAEDMLDKAAGTVSSKRYAEWFSQIEEKCKSGMLKDWGAIPGNLFTVNDKIVIAGTMNGNVFIGLQPVRGMVSDSTDLYHSQDVTAPHNYLAYYRWLTEELKVNAVVHMGCHGTLEWLPGKGNGVSKGCSPDIVLGHVPHIYPYAISNPGEGVHARRRSGAVIIDHLIPSMTRAGGYDVLTDIESLVQECMRASSANQNEKKNSILYDIFKKCQDSSMLDDIGLTQYSDIKDLDDKIGTLYDYICALKDNTIKDGLHILGRVPEGVRRDEMIYSLTRLRNGNVPSLRESVATRMGIDLRKAAASPSEMNKDGKLNGELVDLADDATFGFVEKISSLNYDLHECIAYSEKTFGPSDDLTTVITFICETLVPNILKTTDEMDSLLSCADGRYVLPGPSGCPTRGNAHLLPTGRNFYSIDPAAIPTPSSWTMGQNMADQMVERHVRDTGSYPRQVGIVIWATDTMKTGGDDIAYVLWLLGVRPIWSSSGSAVIGLEVVPADELKRPRIDVTLRISGLFRDSFPNLINMIDDAVTKISELDEGENNNYLLANLRRDIAESIASGMEPAVAKKKARIRIFGDPPGNYGGGVDTLIGNSQWKDRSELSNAYVEWGGYGYGREFRGEDVKDFFRKRLSGIDVTVKNHESRELDAYDIDDDYIFLGGMNAAIETESGKQPRSMIGDSSNPDKPVTRTLEEEGKFIFRSRVLNPKWIDGLKKHGYRGVQELSNLVEFTFGWDSTSDVVEDWMYQSMTEKFLFDGDNRQWIEENNPDALRSMTSRLLEAIERGLWNADQDTINKLRSMFLDSENILEKANDR